jgi:hypothetical protein
MLVQVNIGDKISSAQLGLLGFSFFTMVEERGEELIVETSSFSSSVIWVKEISPFGKKTVYEVIKIIGGKNEKSKKFS